MDRTRETRRSSMAATSTNGFIRRRNRTIALRDSSEEGAVELREGASKRGRNRDRDRDSMNRNKRRRVSNSHRDEGEHSTDESVGNDQDDVVSASRMRSSNTTSFASDLNHRRSLTTLKLTDEMIGVSVPRKARSVSVKRSHEICVSAGVGGGGGREEHNSRQPSSSPARHSNESASPSSSSVSVPKKMKAIGAALKTSKSSSSDIEIEIAELLYGWRTSKKHESSSSQKLEASIDHQTSLPPRNTYPSSCPSEDVEKKKAEDYTSSALVKSDSTAELGRIQSGQPATVDRHDGTATGHGNGSSEAPKEDTGEDYLKPSAGCGDVAADGRSVSPTGPLCSKLGVDKEDSAFVRGISSVPEAKSQRVGRFEIDLMAPPPMMFPEGDDLSRGDFTSETKAFALDMETKREDNCFRDEEKVEGLVKKERTPEESEEAKKVVFREEVDMLKHDLEKPNNDNDTRTNSKLDEQDGNKDQSIASSNFKVLKTAQSSFAPLSTAVSGRSPTGYMLPLQTVVKMDKTVGSSTTPQHVNFVLSPPRPKKCATHHHIARNIFLHQQYTKTNPLSTAANGSSFLGDTKANDVNCVPSAESMVIGKLSQKHLPGVNQKASQKKESSATSDPSLTTIRSSNNVNPMDSSQRLQLVLQQSPHPGSTGNQTHGPAFLFSTGQHQASVVKASSQAGGLNSTCSASSHNKSHSVAAGSLGTSSMSPAVGAAMSFSYPKFSTNDTPPYVTIVQNNGYSFPLSSSLGATAAIRGASPAQASHILNGPFYSTQMFHPLQRQQQQPHSQALIQPSYLNASTTSSSSSHKLSQGPPVNGNNILTSTAMQSQQSHKQQNSLSHPRKHETEMGGENAPSIANRTSYHQKSVQEQNLTNPVQPLNFSFTPSASDIVGSNGGKFGEKQQQQQASKGGVEIIPSQAFAISFAAFNGTNVPSNLNFSSVPQNPVIFHSLPDITWQGYQAASPSHTIPQKAYSITEGKSGGNSSRQDVEKKTSNGKSSTNGPTTLVFDNSSKNLSFALSPTNGNWPSRSISSTAVTSVPLSSNASSSQQSSQLLQLQKQHGMQQQQPALATRLKASSSKSTATKFANNAPAFSQTLTQCKSSSQGSHSKSLGRNIDSHVHHSSIISSNAASLKNFSQEQGRVSQGHMEISFGGNYITSLPPQGQQLLNNNQPLCATVAGTPFNGGNVKPNSEGRKVSSAMSTSQSQLQQTENSSAGSGQKSSPVCGRNVPSILSSCPSHLSELKY